MKKFVSGIVALAIILSFSGCAYDGSGAGGSAESPNQGVSQNNAATVISRASDDENTLPASRESAADQNAYPFEFNPYVITSEYEDLYGASFIGTYHAFVDAYLNYETDVACESADYAYLINGAVQTCFPVFSSDAYFDYDCLYDEVAKTIHICYTSESKSEHDSYVKTFVDTITDMIESSTQQGDNEILMAIELYTAFSSSLTYDYSSMENNSNADVTPYNAIINRTGICQSFAGAYTYLLLELGIDANICGGLTYDNTVAHEWTILKLHGKYYYADPTFENTETGGLGLRYFGMTTAEREAEGDFNPEYFNIGMTNEIWAGDYQIDDPLFSDLRSCYEYEINHANNSISFYDEGGTIRELTLNT